jgi:hypothetical protein
LKKAILSWLQAWQTDEALTAPSYNWPGLNDTVLSQDSVGWWAFLEGGVLQAWAAKQHEYYEWF